ncbi:hypothetical protein M3J07_002999 [Ascochyta lentis]
MHQERHASLMAELKSIEKDKRSLGIVLEFKLDTVQAEIFKTVGKSTHPLERTRKSALHRSHRLTRSDEEAETEGIQLAYQVQRLVDAMKQLKILQKEQAASLKQVEVIRSLYFREIFRRFEKIHDADPSSNKWAFDPVKTTLPSWLKSQDENDELHYIFGKAGSRKSTDEVFG